MRYSSHRLVMLLRILLIGRLYGITSERKREWRERKQQAYEYARRLPNFTANLPSIFRDLPQVLVFDKFALATMLVTDNERVPP